MTSPAPTSTEVNHLHANSDVDTSATSQHHTIGQGQNQVSNGAHTHNGKNSKKIGKGINLSFPTTAGAAYTQAQIQSIIDALRALGLGT